MKLCLCGFQFDEQRLDPRVVVGDRGHRHVALPAEGLQAPVGGVRRAVRQGNRRGEFSSSACFSTFQRVSARFSSFQHVSACFGAFQHLSARFSLFSACFLNWCNKGHGMCYPACGMVHVKEPLLLIEKNSP